MLHYSMLHYIMLLIPANPGPVKMYVSPRRISSPYSVNETVEFRCTADVGNPPQNRPWSWQWKYADSMMSWTSYPYTNRIQDEPIKPGSCANNGASVLNHLVSVDDNARMIRCVVNNNDDYSDNFTIYTQSKMIHSAIIINYFYYIQLLLLFFFSYF